MSESMETQLAEVMSEILGRDVRPGEDVRRDGESAWTSLRHVELLFLLEETFAVQLSEAELAAIDSSESIRETLARHAA